MKNHPIKRQFIVSFPDAILVTSLFPTYYLLMLSNVNYFHINCAARLGMTTFVVIIALTAGKYTVESLYYWRFHCCRRFNDFISFHFIQ